MFSKLNLYSYIAFLLCLSVAVESHAANDLTSKEKSLIVKSVKRVLKDADSAKFRWMKLPDRINPKIFVEEYCGLVNAKNSYGAYTGFEPFSALVARHSTRPFEVISVTLSGDGLSSENIASMCINSGYIDFESAE